MQICMSFYEGQLKQQMLDTAYFFMLLMSAFTLHQIFPILMIQMPFYEIKQASGPNFRKAGKFLGYTVGNLVI